MVHSLVFGIRLLSLWSWDARNPILQQISDHLENRLELSMIQGCSGYPTPKELNRKRWEYKHLPKNLTVGWGYEIWILVVQKSQISDLPFLSIINKSITILSERTSKAHVITRRKGFKTNILIHIRTNADTHEQDKNMERKGAIYRINYYNRLLRRKWNIK